MAVRICGRVAYFNPTRNRELAPPMEVIARVWRFGRADRHRTKSLVVLPASPYDKLTVMTL